MRILMLTSSFHPVIGGAETYAFEIARGLAGAGHTVWVVTDLPRGIPADADVPGDPEGVVVRRLHRFQADLEDAAKIRWEQMAHGLHTELAACLEEARPDVVMTNSLDTAVLGKTLAIAAGIPWAASFHEQDPGGEPLGEARMRLVYGLLAPRLVLACSEPFAERARRWGSKDRTVLVHHGVDTDLFHPGRASDAVRRRYGIADESLLVVSAGRLKARKGHLETIRAFAQLHAKFPEARLLIVGSVNSASEEYAGRLESELDRLGLRELAQIDRDVTFDGMPGILASADIVSQPSHAEGLSLALLEALSSGRATVATDIPGTREILPVPGIAEVVPPQEVAPLAEALIRLAGDRALRDAYGRRARAHVEESFSCRRMVEETAALLSGLIE
ncbi:glycosyltransferase family 4 protein [Streptomyces naphthomycinicus]|uniref:glycosyltransferase family 4 protein n=1 Tax=Streptomyces naphthomycinicus TaxID=2872625 RepID=UPI001CEDD061|nr:glycosyltransferase family 4 protein [Streptomyces sp. TML10]